MSKRIGWWGLLALLTLLPATAELPRDLDELKQRHEEMGKTPEAFCKLWFDACFVYMNADTRDAGRQMIQYLTIPLKDDPAWDKARSQEYFVKALLRDTHIMRSYAKGSKPENNYAMDPQNYELDIDRVNYNPPGLEQRGIQVSLRSSGADTTRPVYLKKSTQSGLWYMNAHTNVYTGIKPPKDPNKEEFK